jgi:hypothetical protein
MDTAETLDLIFLAVSTVSMTPLKPFSGVIDTAETTMIVKF